MFFLGFEPGLQNCERSRIHYILAAPNCKGLNYPFLGREPWSSGYDLCLKGRGFESQHHILDGHFSHLFVVRIVMFV